MWIFKTHFSTSLFQRNFTSVVCGGDGSSTQLILWTGRAQQFFGSIPSPSAHKHNQSSYSRQCHTPRSQALVTSWVQHGNEAGYDLGMRLVQLGNETRYHGHIVLTVEMTSNFFLKATSHDSLRKEATRGVIHLLWGLL